MIAYFDFMPEKSYGTAVPNRGFYRYRHGNYMLSIATVEALLEKAGIPTDFKAGDLAFRSKRHLDGCVVTCPPTIVVTLTIEGEFWRRTFEQDPLVNLLADNAPVENPLLPLSMWNIVGLGDTFEIDTPLSISLEYRRCQIHAAPPPTRQGNFEFKPDGTVTATRLPVATKVPKWFIKLAELCGAYPLANFSWIQHIRVYKS